MNVSIMITSPAIATVVTISTLINVTTSMISIMNVSIMIIPVAQDPPLRQ
jgi:hypothetical protein